MIPYKPTVSTAAPYPQQNQYANMMVDFLNYMAPDIPAFLYESIYNNICIPFSQLMYPVMGNITDIPLVTSGYFDDTEPFGYATKNGTGNGALDNGNDLQQAIYNAIQLKNGNGDPYTPEQLNGNFASSAGYTVHYPTDPNFDARWYISNGAKIYWRGTIGSKASTRLYFFPRYISGQTTDVKNPVFMNYINSLKLQWNCQDITQGIHSTDPLLNYLGPIIESKDTGYTDGSGNKLYKYMPVSNETCGDYVAHLYAQQITGDGQALLNNSDKFEIMLYEIYVKMNYYNSGVSDLGTAQQLNIFFNYDGHPDITNFFTSFRVFEYLSHTGYVKYKNDKYTMTPDKYFPAVISVYNLSFTTFTQATNVILNTISKYVQYIGLLNTTDTLPPGYAQYCSYETALVFLMNANTQTFINYSVSINKNLHDTVNNYNVATDILKYATLISQGLNFIVPGLGAAVGAGLMAVSNQTAADTKNKQDAINAATAVQVTIISTDQTIIAPAVTQDIKTYIPLIHTDISVPVAGDDSTPPNAPVIPAKNNLLAWAAGAGALALLILGH